VKRINHHKAGFKSANNRPAVSRQMKRCLAAISLIVAVAVAAITFEDLYSPQANTSTRLLPMSEWGYGTDQMYTFSTTSGARAPDVVPVSIRKKLGFYAVETYKIESFRGQKLQVDK
jgi:hypothetical protein